MNNPVQIVQSYLQRIEQAPNPVERSIIVSDLYVYYYRISEENAQLVEALMKPLLEELEQEMIKKDSLLKRAHDVLSIIKTRQAVQA